MHPLQALAEAEKSVAHFPGWPTPDEEDGYSYFQAPLAINGVAQAGLFLCGGTYLGFPDRHVTFEIIALTHDGYRRTKLMRIDWRSLRGGHTNQRKYRCPDCLRRTSDTHFHAFDINWLQDQGRMRGIKLPCARDIPEELKSFEELRACVGKHFRINNIDVVKVPDWEYRLEGI
jgi:hypothetical protein